MLKDIGRTDAEVEAPILWPPDAKSWLIGEKTWHWERLKAGREGDERRDGWMASLTWRAWVLASPGVGDGQGSLVCCSPWGHKESDMTERLNRTELNCHIIYGKGKRLRQNHFGSSASVKKEDQG